MRDLTNNPRGDSDNNIDGDAASQDKATHELRWRRQLTFEDLRSRASSQPAIQLAAEDFPLRARATTKQGQDEILTQIYNYRGPDGLFPVQGRFKLIEDYSRLSKPAEFADTVSKLFLKVDDPAFLKFSISLVNLKNFQPRDLEEPFKKLLLEISDARSEKYSPQKASLVLGRMAEILDHNPAYGTIILRDFNRCFRTIRERASTDPQLQSCVALIDYISDSRNH